MLKLTQIERIDSRHYRVTLDRDGGVLRYTFSFSREPRPEPYEPDVPEELRVRFPGGYHGGATEPDEMWAELDDYNAEIPGSPSRGAAYIPAIYKCRRLVYLFAMGEDVDLPTVLDPR